MSDNSGSDSEDSALYTCKKCPGSSFKSMNEYREHRNKVHPKNKNAQKAKAREENEPPEEMSAILNEPGTSRRTRYSPRTMTTNSTVDSLDTPNETSVSPPVAVESDANNSNQQESDHPDSPDTAPRSPKRGRPGKNTGSPPKGKGPPSRGGKPKATSTPADSGPAKKGRPPAGGKGKGKNVAPWMDSAIFNTKFPGG